MYVRSQHIPPERSTLARTPLKPLIGNNDPTIIEVGGTGAVVAARELESRLKSLRVEIGRRVFS